MKMPKKFYPYSIPYQGSKRSIAFKIMSVIAQKAPRAKYFFDVFRGGGAMSFAAAQFGLKVFYSDIDERLVNLLKFLKDNDIPKEWVRWIDRKDFEIIKNQNNNESTFIALCWSYQNQSEITYPYGGKNEVLASLAFNVALNHDLKSLGILKDKLGINLKSSIDPLHMGFRLYQIERYFRIKRLCHNNFDITYTHQDYASLDFANLPLDEVVVYCDPPYSGTEGYRCGNFDHARFDAWFANLPCTSFLSEYHANFKEIARFTRPSSFNMKTRGYRRKAIEKLFWNGK